MAYFFELFSSVKGNFIVRPEEHFLKQNLLEY
jgi:hypothetical protein